MAFTALDSRELAAELELDVHAVGICHACLCIISFAINGGDEADVRRAISQTAPALWAEGLALPARRALERARVRRVAGADAAIAHVEQRGARSHVVYAIVRRLAEDLLAEMDLPPPAEVVPLDLRR